MTDVTLWWFSYECLCPETTPDSVIVEVRLPQRESEPTVHCPLCRKTMRFRARWEADANGYGSRGNSVYAANVARYAAALGNAPNPDEARNLATELARAAAKLEREQCANTCDTISAQDLEEFKTTGTRVAKARAETGSQLAQLIRMRAEP